MSEPNSTIVITTRNRKEELSTALTSCLMQAGNPYIIVIDDGSTDGTSDMVKCNFPTVSLYRDSVSKGLIAQRNYAAHLAVTPFLFSIDDDAIFTSSNIVQDVLNEFNNPSVGAIAIPFIDVCKDPSSVKQCAPAKVGDFAVSSYIGTAHALRRDLFIRLKGYREQLFHQGEESDYSLRMLEAGYFVKVGRSAAIHHFESPRRDFHRIDFYGRRNNILFGWHNIPSFILPFYLFATVANGLSHGFRVGRTSAMIQGLARGFRDIPSEFGCRSPVSIKTYRLYREMIKRGPLPIVEMQKRLSTYK